MDRLKIEVVLARRITFASQQNDVPLIRDLKIINPGQEDFQNLVLTVAASPQFITAKQWHIDRLRAGEERHIIERDVRLNGQMLMDLNEAIKADLSLTIRCATETEALAHHEEQVELLARHEWGGLETMPELLAAFVTPNDPAVERLLKQAETILRQAGQPSGIDGAYASGSRQRVWDVASSLWSAVCNLKLDYALPPASFERDGQKVRQPSHIIDTGRATCLDTTLLFAAALEQAQLNPVLIITKGHAFVGIWLQPEEFSDLLVDEAASVRKRIDLDELLVFETTCATQHPALPFSKAVAQGKRQLAEDVENTFEMAIDVRRARMRRIKPLPAPGTSATPDDAAIATTGGYGFESSPALPDFEIPKPEAAAETPATRLHKWQRKLLDLSLRNKLLNHGDSKKAIRLFCPDPGTLEDRLAADHKISIVPLPPLADAQNGRSADIHRQRTGDRLDVSYALEALQRNQVPVDLPSQDLEGRLVELYRAVRSDLEEGGANTLFLALGFLIWQQPGKEGRKFRAPLILLPVTLERKSVRSGMSLVRHEDEPRFNPTLLEMLRQDFGLDIRGLDSALPKDEHGIDVKGIWNRLRQETKTISGFEVVEDVVLGRFSFAKFLMWKDLVDRADHLKANPVVRHLIESPREQYGKTAVFPEPNTLDRDYAPDKLLTLLPADSTQLAAVAASAKGSDFILIGPPGTGKSQTITNIIAHNLAMGRSVLFVSEKIAALDVVYQRLRRLGLGEFCLALHSNKARKTEVIAQLRTAWESRTVVDAAEWQRLANRIGQQREILNSFVQHLHQRYPNGLTPFQAIGHIVHDSVSPEIGLRFASPLQHTQEDLEALRETARLIDVHQQDLGHFAGRPLVGLRQDAWSPSWQQALVENAKTLLHTLNTLEMQTEAFCKALGVPIQPVTLPHLAALSALADLLPKVGGYDLAFAFRADAGDVLESLEAGLALLRDFTTTQEQLSSAYAADAWHTVPVADLQAAWATAATAWALKAWRLKRQVRKSLVTTGQAQGIPDPAQDLPLLARLKALGEQIQAVEGISKIWAGFKTNQEQLAAGLTLATELRRIPARLAEDTGTLLGLRTALERLFTVGRDLIGAGGTVGAAAERFLHVWQPFITAHAKLLTLTALEQEPAALQPDLSNLRALLTEIVQEERRLKAWCDWQRLRKQAVAQGLECLVTACENGTVRAGEAGRVFETAYCRWWLGAVVDDDVVLRNFNAPQHEDLIRAFREADEAFARSTREYLRATLGKNTPATATTVRHDEFGVLQREFARKKGGLSLRQIIQEMPTALTRLTPCLMMSPLSIAQYLSTEQAMFDLVVFDEASQITVWDAVGALARGKQAIIVGDPKQLPPTNFFGRHDTDDEDGITCDGATEKDLDSILDECLGAGIPQRHLSWHYRSAHESLIAFSNHRYYQGRLITFPSPATQDRAVRMVPVSDGVYERGSSRTNPVEARALVSEVVAYLQGQRPDAIGKSIGIVTFNSEQQRLIENLLDEERRKNPALEVFFGDAANEPVFVKNLESVQGDERDIMFFSITYGADHTGLFHLTSIQQLNREGGERRLNVAITRARSELVVFATLRPDQINLSRTQSVGIRDFKHFLEFAERGPQALAEAIAAPRGDYDSPFEEAVAVALRQKGWEVHTQIGVSAYRIDLGIVHPDAPGRYLAGIECDGATYHSAATARDRDKIRESVLRHLGWEIMRIWSTDWWIDADGALAKVCARLDSLLEASRQPDTAGTSDQQPADITNVSAIESTAEGLPDPAAPVTEAPITEATVTETQAANDSAPGPETHRLLASNQAVVRSASAPVPAAADGPFSLYPITNLTAQFGAEINRARFYDAEYDFVLRRMIDLVVENEGPILSEILVQRIARAHGFDRSGPRIADAINTIASRHKKKTKEGKQMFYWPNKLPLGEPVPFRRAAAGDTQRTPVEICREELMALALVAWEQRPRDPVGFMAETLSIGRLSQQARERLEEVLRAVAERSRSLAT